MRVLGNRVLVELVKQDMKLESGLLLQKTDVEHKPQSAIVTHIGDSVESMKVGDKVIIPAKSGVKIVVDGKDLLMLIEAEILAIS